MALTDVSDLYCAVDEEGINLVAQHLMRKRPSLFNYATAGVSRSELLCRRIDAAPEVLARGNLLVTLEDPLEIVGTDGAYGLDYCVQLTDAKVDFAPGNSISLPPELAPLGAQKFAVMAGACAGIACPPTDVLLKLPPPRPMRRDDLMKRRPQAIPGGRLECFCLELHVVGSFRFDGWKLMVTVEGVELVDIKPEGLESALECYVRVVLQLAVMPKVAEGVETLVLKLLESLKDFSVALEPPDPSAVPNNPAIENDLLKVRADVTVMP